MQVSSGGGLQSDINVTPLVDVVLVLLIIFMVIVPLTQRGYDIQIPREIQTDVPPDPEHKQVILAINGRDCAISGPLPVTGLPGDCQVWINKEPVPVTSLAVRISEIFKNRRPSDKVLFLAAEEALNYEGVMQILGMAKSGSGEDLKVGIVTDEALARVGGTGGTP